MLASVKRFLILLLVLILSTAAHAWQQVNENAPEPPREFRAAWVATVFNLDWPSRAGLSAGQQKQELLNIITRAHKLRLNAIILQVRPNGDALYKSTLEPWSGWLSGPGVNPGYDPLAFAITECHKRGMELHAWFNPFRATISNRPRGQRARLPPQPGLDSARRRHHHGQPRQLLCPQPCDAGDSGRCTPIQH